MSTITTRLSGLLRKMKPSQRVQVPVHRRSTDAVESLEQLASGQSQSSKSNGSSKASSILKRMPGAKRDAAINQLHEGFTEVVDLIRNVRVHLDQQADRSERLLGLMENLPEALRALPETNRNQARMVEAMNTHVEQQNRQSARLNEALSGLANASEHQSQVMGVLQEQIHAARRTDEQLLGSFGAMNQTLVQLSQSSQANVQTLRRATEQSDKTARTMDQLMKRTTRNMTILSVTGWVIAATALGVAVWTALISAGVI